MGYSSAKAIFAPPLEIEKTDTLPQSRKQFAEWITSEANPRFTCYCKSFMETSIGIGLIEPVDDMKITRIKQS